MIRTVPSSKEAKINALNGSSDLSSLPEPGASAKSAKCPCASVYMIRGFGGVPAVQANDSPPFLHNFNFLTKPIFAPVEQCCYVAQISAERNTAFFGWCCMQNICQESTRTKRKENKCRGNFSCTNVQRGRRMTQNRADNTARKDLRRRLLWRPKMCT